MCRELKVVSIIQSNVLGLQRFWNGGIDLRLTRFSVFLVLLLTLTACGGNEVVVTTDDSADYKSARQLPPLSKVIDAPPELATSSTQNSNEKMGNSLGAQELPKAVSVSIVSISDTVQRLKIDSNLDTAWGYLLNQLRRSRVTVHTRNRAAARIQIGCADINEGPSVAERGGWKIFVKDDVVYEYCALQFIEDKQVTLVSVQNRRGAEVDGVEAAIVFDKILN